MAGGIPTTPTTPTPTYTAPSSSPTFGQPAGLSRNQKIGLFLSAISDAYKGQDVTANMLQRQAMLQGQQKQAEQDRLFRQLAQDPRYADQIKLLKAGIDPRLVAGAGGERKIREDVAGVPRYTDTGERVFPDVEIPEKSAVSDPLRTITMGGKVVKNVRDSELTTEEIQKINEAGQVIQPLGFTEKMESSKDVDFSPIKSKYLATENIIVKTSELAQKFVDNPSSALAVGSATQFIDGIIQNIDVGGNLLSGAKNKRAYEYVQKTSKSLEGKDFTDAIQKTSRDTGVASSRIRDLAYLFAAARGQEGRGLSDKDYENALKIVAGGVGPSGRIAVLKDVANSLRNEFYRDINFDIATSENAAYVNKLKGLPELQYFTDPVLQQSIPTTSSSNIEALLQKYGD